MTTLISGSCIRLYPADHATTPGPRWHINDQHATVGLIDTSEQPTIDAQGYLVVKFLNIGPRAVVSMSGNPDEALTGLGISAGCSNGGPYARIRLVKRGLDGQPAPLDLNSAVHWSRVAGQHNNLWPLFVHHVPDGRDLVTTSLQFLTDPSPAA